MSLMFWRQTKNTGQYRPDGIAQTKDVAVSETSALPVRPLLDDGDDPLRVSIADNIQPPVAGQTVIRQVQVPGVGTGSAYTAGEAFGTVIKLSDVFRPSKNSGTLTGILFHDLDDEGSQIDVHFFSEEITTSTDNNAFGPSDSENLMAIGSVSITEFFNWGSNQLGVLRNLSLPLVSHSPDVYVRLVTQATPTIAAGAVPFITFYFTPD